MKITNVFLFFISLLPVTKPSIPEGEYCQYFGDILYEQTIYHFLPNQRFIITKWDDVGNYIAKGNYVLSEDSIFFQLDSIPLAPYTIFHEANRPTPASNAQIALRDGIFENNSLSGYYQIILNDSLVFQEELPQSLTFNLHLPEKGLLKIFAFRNVYQDDMMYQEITLKAKDLSPHQTITIHLPQQYSSTLPSLEKQYHFKQNKISNALRFRGAWTRFTLYRCE